jgi:hypothetical protein
MYEKLEFHEKKMRKKLEFVKYNCYNIVASNNRKINPYENSKKRCYKFQENLSFGNE